MFPRSMQKYPLLSKYLHSFALMLKKLLPDVRLRAQLNVVMIVTCPSAMNALASKRICQTHAV